MKKTKIICSIGPASEPVEVMTQMVKAGMDCARINFSHASYEDNDRVVNIVKEVRRLTGKHISILYDTKGPDFRCLTMKEEGVNLVEGATIRMVKDNVVGTEEAFSVNYPDAIDKIQIGMDVLIDDGLFKLNVIGKDDRSVTCKIINGGVLTSKKGIAVPGCNLDLPFLSQIDIEDIKYACSHEGDFIALSFVQTPQNVEDVRRLLIENGRGDMQIISKVESVSALNNLDAIIEASDGIMVARGDLGVEVPIERLPIIQKDMIRKCREKEKFVIVATEMLASMYTSPRPTRAEVTDISNAVLDGTDAVMLSGESTVGKHPVDAVSYMARICEEAEKFEEYGSEFTPIVPNDITEAVASAVIASASQLDVKAIVVPTTGGHSARVISNLRPNTIILALCLNERVARGLSINYGVYPIVVDVNHDDMDDVAAICRSVSINKLDLKEHDIVVIAGGIHENPDIKQTNFMKIEEI